MDSQTLTLIGSSFTTILLGIFTYRQATKIAELQQRGSVEVQRIEGGATVEIARIEANSGTEAHLWEELKAERAENKELRQQLRDCDKDHNTSMARNVVLEAKVRILEDECAEQLQEIAGLKTRLNP